MPEPTVRDDLPPRHTFTGNLCIRAIIKRDCPLQHDYYRGALTPEEKRWIYVERMLEELAALEPESGKPEAGDAYEVDEVLRAEDGLIASVFGTRVRRRGDTFETHPYILGDV